MPMGGVLTARAVRRGDFFITGGEEMAAQIREIKPGAAVEVVLHPRYDLPYTRNLPEREEARSRLGLDGEEAVFLFFGLVREYKGLDVLLEALAMLPRQRGWTCLVAGEFYESREPYETRIRDLDLADRVRIEDRYIPNNEVPLYFAAADLTVLPYRHATQSGVAALSFALNRPVLTTSVGALPEMITQGENGWLVPPEDPVALSSVLLTVADDRRAAHLPVVDGLSGLPDWGDLARAVIGLAADAGKV
jgi:glycosyltransferase involved in cell wall biosynthesis